MEHNNILAYRCNGSVHLLTVTSMDPYIHTQRDKATNSAADLSFIENLLSTRTIVVRENTQMCDGIGGVSKRGVNVCTFRCCCLRVRVRVSVLGVMKYYELTKAIFTFIFANFYCSFIIQGCLQQKIM
jgi:hypothetical protein